MKNCDPGLENAALSPKDHCHSFILTDLPSGKSHIFILPIKYNMRGLEVEANKIVFLGLFSANQTLLILARIRKIERARVKEGGNQAKQRVIHFPSISQPSSHIHKLKYIRNGFNKYPCLSVWDTIIFTGK